MTFQTSKTRLKTKRFFMKYQISSSVSGDDDPEVFGTSKDIEAEAASWIAMIPNR